MRSSHSAGRTGIYQCRGISQTSIGLVRTEDSMAHSAARTPLKCRYRGCEHPLYCNTTKILICSVDFLSAISALFDRTERTTSVRQPHMDALSGVRRQHLPLRKPSHEEVHFHCANIQTLPMKRTRFNKRQKVDEWLLPVDGYPEETRRAPRQPLDSKAGVLCLIIHPPATFRNDEIGSLALALVD